MSPVKKAVKKSDEHDGSKHHQPDRHEPKQHEPKHGKSKDHKSKHHEPKRHKSKDLRKAYEHLGRVESLQRAVLPAPLTDVATLVSLARKELQSGDNANGACLLRAAEHLSFAALLAGRKSAGGENSKISAELGDAIAEELDHLARKAEEHLEHKKEEKKEHHPDVSSIYKSSLKKARSAQQQGSYREALESMRAAEALTHLEAHGDEKLHGGKKQLKLSAA